MKKIYIKNTKDYKLVHNTNIFKIERIHMRNSYYYNINKQIIWEEVINPDIIYEKYYSRASTLFCGKGLILTPIFEILCLVASDNTVLINSQLALEYSSEIKRIKKAINDFGWSSRKQIKIIDDLTEMFVFDPLKPTFNSYDENLQKQLSEEFLLTL
jgi:hypothetical protein